MSPLCHKLHPACLWGFTQHPSLPWWAQGDGDTAAACPPCGLGGHIPALGIAFLSPGCLHPPGSLRSLCSICCPAWSCCQTSHCDTVPEAELAPLVSQTVPNPCGCQREPNPRDWPGAVVHLMSIYDGLCNFVFPRFDLTRYKLKPFPCGRREEQFLLC